MVSEPLEVIAELLKGSDGRANVESTKASISKVNTQMRRCQERVRKYIDDNYVEFMPDHDSSDLLLDEAEKLVNEADAFIATIESDTESALGQANSDLVKCENDTKELVLGLRVSYLILKIDDIFQCIDDANSTKDYLVAIELLGKLKNLIFGEDPNEIERVFRRCDCYETIKVKYHIQLSILLQNLQSRFESLVQFSEKQFPSSKRVTIKISKDNRLQDTVLALFQARYNPIKMCEFLLENCFKPIILKPVSIESSDGNPEDLQLSLSYSLKELPNNLRPSPCQVFNSIKAVFNALKIINVPISETQHVFTIVGDHIKRDLLMSIVNDCLMQAIPETMDEFQESTIIEDVIELEHFLADMLFINVETDNALSEFCKHFETYFHNRFSNKLIESAQEIMQKDLQDMVCIADQTTPDDVASNPFLFPRCMISKSTLELIKLLERILTYRKPTSSNETCALESNSAVYILNVIEEIINCYVERVPKIHKKFLDSIPQQSVLLFNNCMFLAHWVTKNATGGIATFSVLDKLLTSTGNKYLKKQVAYQQKLVMEIVKEMDLSDAHSIGTAPMKLIRQCMRQLDLLKNVWLNVLPDNVYNTTFCAMLNDFCSDIIKRIMGLEDISATVANELSEMIDVVLEKGPTFFKEKNDVIHIKSWMKLKQLKMILNASLQEITEQWCEGAGILTANYGVDEMKHLIRALFQNTDRRAKALAKIN